MEVNTPASIRAFRAKSAADKVLSYMWYIHVLVSVNTETRLRANIAPLLEESVPPSSVLPASPDGTYVDRPGEHDRQDQEQQQQPQQPQQSRHCLTDHLVLWLFNHDTLPRLIDTAPVFAQANGYARILAAIPVSFHEEFCRRLYTLLFSKRIVEWPHDIDVPEPAIAAAEPAVVVVDEVPIGWEDTHHYDPKHEHQDVRGADLDGVMEDKDEEERALPATLLRPAASLWLQTPSLSSWDGNDIPPMERAAHFGTVSHPLPTDYFTDWAWSRNGSGPQVCVDEHESSGAQLKAPFSSPQTRGSALPGTLQTSICDTSRNEPPSPLYDRRQGRRNPGFMYSDGIENQDSEVSRRSSGITTGSRVCRFSRGRMGMGHSTTKQPVVRDEQQEDELDRKRGLTGGRRFWSASS